MNMKKFAKERDNALLSLDKNKILAYCKKYDVPVPEDEEVFWAGVHKAIVNTTSISFEKKLVSIAWLREHGFSPNIY